jgi:hypothetical protein
MRRIVREYEVRKCMSGERIDALKINKSIPHTGILLQHRIEEPIRKTKKALGRFFLNLFESI